MPEQTKNAAVSGEWKLVPVAQLKKWHRDLDACQKVMWLRGGFDPAYCMDAQDCLKEMEGVLAAPVPPAAMDESNFAPGGWKIERTPDGGFCLSHPTHGRGFFSDRGHKPAVVVSRFLDALLTYGPTAERLQAEIAALKQRLNTADQLVDELQKDKERLDALEANYWDVRHHSSALGDTGDYTSCVEIVGHWMDKPNERVIGENYNENLRAAIDQAMTADAYPPARPEYPELDAALPEEDWHMNPCKQGHSDVGACQGKAFCHTCDETITAETTQQAFEEWNATHQTDA